MFSKISRNGPPTGRVKHGHFGEVVNLQKSFSMLHKHLEPRNKGPFTEVVECMGSCWVGKQYTSSFGHDPWLANISEWSILAFKSYCLETLTAEEKINKF